MKRVSIPLLRRLRRFGRQRRGAAAMEFALVALPFFWLMLALAEVTLVGFAQVSLDYAISETGRRIRTGEIQTQGLTEAAVRNSLCQQMGQFLSIDCANLTIDVDAYAGFVNVQNPNPVLPNGTLNNATFNFNPGAPSDIVLVRAFYQWQILTPLFEPFLANMGTNTRLVTSTMLFRNEPFPEP